MRNIFIILFALLLPISVGAYTDHSGGGDVTASSTTTFTNKTIDANGTGNSISNIDIEDLADGTDGQLITWDSSGSPAAVAVGTSGQVLTSNGAGAAPTFQAASGGASIPIQDNTEISASDPLITLYDTSTSDGYALDCPTTDCSVIDLGWTQDAGSTHESNLRFSNAGIQYQDSGTSVAYMQFANQELQVQQDWSYCWTTSDTGIGTCESGLFYDKTDTIVASTTDSSTPDVNITAQFLQGSATTGITASTTQTQGQGALTSQINEVATVATDGDTVTLPDAVAGRELTVINNGANDLQIFPKSGDNLGAGVDTSITIGSGMVVAYEAYDATNWGVSSFGASWDAEVNMGSDTINVLRPKNDGDGLKLYSPDGTESTVMNMDNNKNLNIDINGSTAVQIDDTEFKLGFHELNMTHTGATPQLPASTSFNFYVTDNADRGSGTASDDCALIMEDSAGTEVVVVVFATDAEC